MPQKAYKFTSEVLEGGKVELTLPLPPGCRVEVLVLTEEAEDDFKDMLDAATSSMGFWDDPEDEAEWKNTPEASSRRRKKELTNHNPG